MESDSIFRDSFVIGLGVTAGNKLVNFISAFIEEICLEPSLPPPPKYQK